MIDDLLRTKLREIHVGRLNLYHGSSLTANVILTAYYLTRLSTYTQSRTLRKSGGIDDEASTFEPRWLASLTILGIL